MYSYLMIGQSNMAGRGDFGEVEPINNSSCYMLRMGRWQPMSEPVNPDRAIFDKDFHSGISLGASFADMAAKKFNTDIGLIPCADGATCLNMWMPGEILFEHAVFQTKLAMRSSQLKAILWHQGEDDCKCDNDVDAYSEKFKIIISQMRKQLDSCDIPVMIGELSENITSVWKLENRPQKLNKVFKKIEKEVSNCILVPAKDLPLKSDGIHFSSPSYRTLGTRYFEKYIELIDKDL